MNLNFKIDHFVRQVNKGRVRGSGDQVLLPVIRGALLPQLLSDHLLFSAHGYCSHQKVCVRI